jgi:lipoic acid synthetase
VAQYLSPDIFDQWRLEALAMGFAGVASGPFVRSSYRADALCDAAHGAK